MRILQMTYARVATDATLRAMVNRPHDTGIDLFLSDHAAALFKLAKSDDSPSARFVDEDAKATFRDLVEGSPAEFLAAAGSLAARLIGAMDGRSAPGLLVCMRFELDGVVSAAALKLQVVTPNAAILERLDSGEEILSAATDVLDAPGQLQKGALVYDPRPGSEVIVGDKLTTDAQYFPRAFGIRTEQRGSDAAVDLLNNLDAPADVRIRVGEALSSVDSGTTGEVLEALAATIPELTASLRSGVETVLSERPRPVSNIDTTAPVKRVITADGVTVVGSINSMRNATYSRDPQGGWVITIHVTEEPKLSFKR